MRLASKRAVAMVSPSHPPPSVPIRPEISEWMILRTEPPTMGTWMGILLVSGETPGGNKEAFPEYRDPRGQ